MVWSWLIALTAVLASALAGSKPALAWPDRTVTVVVGYGPGGTADSVARLVCQRLGQQLGHQFIVENRPGANGNVAAAYVARSSPDGYTLLLGGSNNVTNSSLYRNLTFDFSADLAPVGMIVAIPNLLVD